MSRIPTSRKIVGVSAAFLAALVVMTVVVVGGALLRTPAYALPAPLQLSGQSQPAAVFLDATIDRLRRAAEVPPDPRRPITFTHLQTWTMDTTDVHTPITIHDQHRFWAPDRSGRRRDVTVSEAEAVAVRTRTPADRYEAFLPAEYPLPFFTISLPVDPVTLKNQLADFEPLDNGPHVLARTIAAAFEDYCLDIVHRIALLTLLKDVPDLVSRGPVVDRGGRGGIALTVDSGNPNDPNQPTHRARDVLVFGDDGNLLSHELVAIEAPTGLPDLPTPAVMAYTLILTAAMVPTWPAALDTVLP